MLALSKRRFVQLAGLSIARRLAEAQEGTLTYKEREGGGAVFELRLPSSSP